MVNKDNYTDPSEFTENDDIYDEETDYYTEDCDLCNIYENRLSLNDMCHFSEYNPWR